MANVFLTPYQEDKILEGVIPANNLIRSNFLQGWFPEAPNPLRTGKSVNFDVEFKTKVIPAMHVAPEVDAPIVTLGGHGHKELYFAYVKEGYASPDIEEIDFRQLGQPFGTVDWWSNYLNNLRQKAALTEANIETRFEVNAASLITTGKYTAVSQYHPAAVLYDFNRTKVTDDATFLAGDVPEVDLTTLDGNGGVGKRAWNATGGTTAPTPYKDFITACSTTMKSNVVEACLMADDAYELFAKDIYTNYKDAANINYQVENRITLDILPMVKKYDGVGYRGSFKVAPGIFVDIYTYNSKYHDRITGVETRFIPQGTMIILPNKQLGVKIYGRIKHIGAQFEPRKRFTNIWLDPKTKEPSAEVHVNYLMGHRDINSLVYWKVM